MSIFLDFNLVGDTDYRRSTSGIVVSISNTPNRWFAKKQDSTNYTSFTVEFSSTYDKGSRTNLEPEIRT